MWEDILLSLGMSIAEAIGVKFIEQGKKQKMFKKLNKSVNDIFTGYADSSLDCNEFSKLICNNKFADMIRNYFLTIEDGMDKNLYIDSMEYYICKECKSVKRIEVRRFIKDIEELYNEYLHKIIEDNSSVYALFQLITISHREIITKILENENNIKRYFDSLEDKKISISDENIKLFHQVCEREYGLIRFTGISGAERKKEQKLKDFYIENTFSYYGKEAESFAESFDENVVYCLKYARNRETAMNYTIEDKKLIREVFNALTKVRVTGETDQRTEDFQDILTFELPMGKSCTLVFEAGNLVVGDKVYKISDAEDLWALTTQIALENEPEGHHENQHGDRHHE